MVAPTLEGILRPHAGLGKSRLETLCLIVVGMISVRTVNLSHRLGADWSATLVIGLLGLVGPWHPARDRTQWKLGTRDVNVLMLAVITRRRGCR